MSDSVREDHHQPGDEAGLTPLALASQLGRRMMFNEIMELHRVELWRYSNINCSLYPIQAVDTIGIDGNLSTCEPSERCEQCV